MRNRIQAYDSPFSLLPTDGVHAAQRRTSRPKIKSQKGVPVFDDHKGTYWYEANPTGGCQDH